MRLKNFLILIAALLLLTSLSVVLDIPVVRQISGFIFLTFVPGFLILAALKLNRIGGGEQVVLAMGTSIAFTMLFGLVLNSLLPVIGYAKPLSYPSLLISFDIAIVILVVIAGIRNRDGFFPFPTPGFTIRDKVLLLVPLIFPLLSIVGIRLMNMNDNNILLMILLFIIPAFVVFISFYRRKVPDKLYPYFIILISLSLLLMLSLRSNHILGADIHESYYFFQVTLNNQHWDMQTSRLVNSILSISLLPSIYHIFLNMPQEGLFRILFPILFSVSPLIVYTITKKYIGYFYSFIASFMFMSQVVFLWTTASAQTNIAILFFALSIMCLFLENVGDFARKFLFIVFLLASVVSHYSTAYIFFFILLFTWIGMSVLPIIFAGRKWPATASQPWFKKNITGGIVILFLVAFFFWYSQITTVAFDTGIGLIYRTLTSLNQWFLIESKGPEIVSAFGEGISTIPQQIRLVVSWCSITIMVFGVFWTVTHYRKMVAFPGSVGTDILSSKLLPEYFMLLLVSFTLLVASFLLPWVSVGYSMERVYFHLLTILAPFFIIGSIALSRMLHVKPQFIMLLVLVPFFMCTTGIMYQIFNVPTSIILNSAGEEYQSLVVHNSDSSAAKWLRTYAKERTMVYTGTGRGPRILMSQGGIPPDWIKGSFIPLYQEANREDATLNGYIYLRNVDISVYQVTSVYSDLFARKSKIYATGGAEIYR